MKKTMVYLADDIHEGLRQLAFDKRVSMAELVRRAVEAAYGEILEDIRDAEAELAEYYADPSSSISLEKFLKQQETSVPRRNRVPRSARTKSVARA